MSNNKVLKIIIVAQIIALILAILGTINSYNLLRWDVLLVTITLGYLSVSSRRYYWGVIFIFFALLFNPINTPSLSRIHWIWADISLIIFLTFWFLDYFAKYNKGLLFEKFIIDKFPKDTWTLVDYTRDLHKKLNRFIESDSNPDCVFRKNSNGKTFAVECKYRSNYWTHDKWGAGITWDKNQGDRYVSYSNQKNIPVYVAIGIGGNPKSPEIISYVPIEIIQKLYYKFIPKSVLAAHQNIPTL